MIYELRIYHCAPQKLPELNKRFQTTTLGFWQKHGIEQVGFFTTVIGESNQSLTYLLKWQNLAEREQKWNAFANDPEWIKARAETEKEGIIVERIENTILAPTAYSTMK